MARPWSSPGLAGMRRLSPRTHRIQPCLAVQHARTIATNAAIRDTITENPAIIPPVPTPQRSKLLERKEAIKNAKPFSEFLTDNFHRQHDYLRISITERCNLRCLYCMPEEGVPLSPPAHMLTTPEIFYLSSLFVSQGVTKIRLTGGEPTVRRDILSLMQQIGSLRPKGLRELALTTNGISLHRKLDAMVEYGLTGINLSLDTLDPFQFQIMTRRKGFDAVMKSIDRVLEMNKMGAGVKLKVNCVVMRGLNEREIIPFVEMGREKDIEVRFIEYMPFGGNKWSQGKMVSFSEMLDIIRTKYPELRSVPGHKNDTSKTYKVPGFVGRVGFITSMTNDFCGSCNRLRITGDGNLKVCLHGNAEVSLRDLLRQGNNGEPIDEEAFQRIRQVEMDRHNGRLSEETALGWGQRERDLLEMIGAAVKRKAEKHADLEDLAKMDNRPMILIDRGSNALDAGAQWRRFIRDVHAPRRGFHSSFGRRYIHFRRPRSNSWIVRLTKAKDVKEEDLYTKEQLEVLRKIERLRTKFGYEIKAVSESSKATNGPDLDRLGQITEMRHLLQNYLDFFRILTKDVEELKKMARNRRNLTRKRYEMLNSLAQLKTNWKKGLRKPQDQLDQIVEGAMREMDIDYTEDPRKPLVYEAVQEDTDDTLASEEPETHQDIMLASFMGSKPAEPLSTRDLRGAIVPSGFIPIDAELILNLNTNNVQDLKAQMIALLRRLGRTYPRKDDLPAHITQSKNAEVLKAGLRMLAGRWKEKSTSLEGRNPESEEEADQRLQKVLDQMVRDHDLSNKAAERMATRSQAIWRRKRLSSSSAHLSPNKRPTPSQDSNSPTETTQRPFSTSSRSLLPKNNDSNPIMPDETSKSASTTADSQPQQLPHLTSTGAAHMVSITSKATTHRTAIAVGTVSFSNPTPLSLIRANALKKGDVLAVSRIAGIMAAKKCPDLVPLCHPIPLTSVGVEIREFDSTQAESLGLRADEFGGMHVEARVQCTGSTGVEMEALTAVMGAALSVVDMCKAVDKGQSIGGVRVVLKEGGRSGTWKEEGWRGMGAQ